MKMIDPTKTEIEAMQEGARMGGEYLDSIKKTDLATMSYQEWMTFIEVICTGFTTIVDVEDRKPPKS